MLSPMPLLAPVIRSVLIVGEVALALVLLTGAALLIRSYVALRSVRPGFEVHNVLTTQMSLSATGFEKTSDLDRLVREGVRGIRSLPDVETAGAACCVPLETVWQLSFTIEGRRLDGQFHGFAGWTFISRNTLMHSRSLSSEDAISPSATPPERQGLL